jgi:hypothetical protein
LRPLAATLTAIVATNMIDGASGIQHRQWGNARLSAKVQRIFIRRQGGRQAGRQAGILVDYIYLDEKMYQLNIFLDLVGTFVISA